MPKTGLIIRAIKTGLFGFLQNNKEIVACGYAIATDNNNRILIAGLTYENRFDMALWCLLPDGALDTSSLWGKGGKTSFRDGIFSINLGNNTGLDQLKDAVLFHVQQLAHVGQEVPKTRVDVRKRIEELARERDYISFEVFESVCREEEITEIEKIIML